MPRLRLIGITTAMVEAQITDLAAQQIVAAQDIEDEAERQLTIDAIVLERDLALIDWQDAGHYERNHPLLNDVAEAFDQTSQEVDALWLWATEL